MRDCVNIPPDFWSRGIGRRLRGNAHAQLVGLYLITCAAANMIGIYYLPIVVLMHETGLTEAQARDALRALAEADVAHYDDSAELVWVPQMARYQIGDELRAGDKRRLGQIRAEIQMAGDHPFLAAFWRIYGDAYRLGPGPRQSRPLPPRSDHAGGVNAELRIEHNVDPQLPMEPTITLSPSGPIEVHQAQSSAIDVNPESRMNRDLNAEPPIDRNVHPGQSTRAEQSRAGSESPPAVVLDERPLLTNPEPSTSKSKARAKTTRGTRIPADWRPKPETIEAFRRDGVDPEPLVPEFVDYWIAVAGARGVKLDWEATFRNRVRALIEQGRAPRWVPPMRKAMPCPEPEPEPELTEEQMAKNKALLREVNALFANLNIRAFDEIDP